MRSTDVASDQLVTAPRPLDHLDRLPVSKTAVTCWTAVRRRNQSLVGLAVGAIEKVGEEATGLAHGDP